MDSFDLASVIQTISVYALPVLLAITLHEAAHGYAARLFGDHTAEQAGRITLNPLPHIDLIGTILIPIGLYVLTAGSFLFGYAKPVPVNFSALRSPKRDMIWVAAAGPLSNLVMSILWAIFLTIQTRVGLDEQIAGKTDRPVSEMEILRRREGLGRVRPRPAVP
jgi:Zn-dependent protease